MTKTKRNFAILMVIVCLLANTFSFSAFADSAEDSGEGAKAPTTWDLALAKTDIVLGLRDGVTTAQISPRVIKPSDKSELLNLTGVASSGDYEVKYSSSDKAIASVDNLGNVTAHLSGDCFVSVTVLNRKEFSAVTKEASISVSSDITDFTLLEDTVNVTPGSTYKILKSTQPSDAKLMNFTYTSSNPDVIPVNEDGVVTIPQDDGTLIGQTADITVTAKIVSGNTTSDVSKTVKITVTPLPYDDMHPVMYDMNNQLADGNAITPDNPSPGSTAAPTLVKETTADVGVFRGWDTGWKASLAGSNIPDESDIQHSYVYHAVGYPYALDPFDATATTFNGIILNRDDQASEAAIGETHEIYRWFHEDTDGTHEEDPNDSQRDRTIDFDADNQVYYVQFLFNHADEYGDTYSTVDFGGKFKVKELSLGGQGSDGPSQTRAVGQMFADFGSYVTSSNPSAYNLDYFSLYAYTLVNVKIVTNKTGDDKAYFKFFGQKDAPYNTPYHPDVKKYVDEHTVFAPTWDPDSWDYVENANLTGKVDYIGFTDYTMQSKANHVGKLGMIQIYKGSPVAAASLQVPVKEVNLEVGQSYKAQASVLPFDATEKVIDWGSQDPTVASVDSAGLITANKPGQTTISVDAPSVIGGTNKESITVKVNKSLKGLDVSKASTDLGVGKSSNLSVTGIPSTIAAASERLSGSSALSFSSSDPSVVSISNSGAFTALDRGISTVKATYTNSGSNASAVTAGVKAIVAAGSTLSEPFSGSNYSATKNDRLGSTDSYALAADGSDHTFTGSNTLDNGAAEAWFYDDGFNKDNYGVTINGKDSDSIFVGVDSATGLNNYTISVNGTKEPTSVERSVGWKQIVVDRTVQNKTIVSINDQDIKTIDGSNSGLVSITANSDFANPAADAVGPVGYFDDFGIWSLEGHSPRIGSIGVVLENGTLTATEDYYDPDNDPESGTTFTWYAAETGSTYSQVATGKHISASLVEGKNVKVTAVPKDVTGMTGEPVTSIPYFVPVSSVGNGNGSNPGGSVVVGPGTGSVVTPTPIPVTNYYTDIAGHWAAVSINYLSSKGLLSGYEDKTFKPDNNISRAEFVTMIAKAIGLPSVNYDGGYNDVSASDWYANYIQAASAAGLISGSDGAVRPNDLITREEMSKIIVAAYQYKKGGDLPSGSIDNFADKDSISDWAVSYIAAANQLGFVKGMTDSTFAPKDNATRGQSATMISRLYDAIN